MPTKHDATTATNDRRKDIGFAALINHGLSIQASSGSVFAWAYLWNAGLCNIIILRVLSDGADSRRYSLTISAAL